MDVREGKAEAHQEGFGPPLAPGKAHQPPAAQGRGQKEKAEAEGDGPVEHQGRKAQVRYQVFIPEGVGADSKPDRQGVGDSPPGGRLPAETGIACHEEKAHHDEASPGQAHRTRPFPKEDDRPRRRHHRGRSPGDGVDHRKVGGPVGPLEDENVKELQQDGDAEAGQLGRAEGWLLEDKDSRRNRGVEGGRNDAKKPGKLGPALDPLGQKIPGGVDQGGGKDQAEGRRGHMRL